MNALVRYAYIRALIADKKGVTAIEYGVIAALIIAVSVVILGTLGGTLQATFTALNTAILAA
jgi:pilus assembly protein Flp/PilA